MLLISTYFFPMIMMSVSELLVYRLFQLIDSNKKYNDDTLFLLPSENVDTSIHLILNST